MEDELNLEETVMFMNGEPRQDSSRKTQNWTWRTKYPIFIAVTLLAAALVILTVTFIWHARASGTLEARIASSSFQFCGNQSRKACIQDHGCLLSRMRRLVNGKTTKEGTWPWMAELVYNKKHYCGAVLVSRDVFITAAHCLFHHEHRLYEDDIEIRIGSRRKLSKDENTQIFRVSDIHIHDEFKLSSLQNDIALLRIKSTARFTNSVWPICIAASDQRSSWSSYGIMIGWGKTNYQGKFSTMLRESSVPFVPISKCMKTNRGLFDGVQVSSSNHICVGYGKEKPDYGCNGDSGGPLMVQSNTGKWLVIGIMSWGAPKCASYKTDSYTVFTNIYPYMNWIESILKRNR